jgi:hypothetical protein
VANGVFHFKLRYSLRVACNQYRPKVAGDTRRFADRSEDVTCKRCRLVMGWEPRHSQSGRGAE